MNEIERKEQEWKKDHDAYRRLRKEGYQPHQVDGAGTLESKATDRMEIEMAHVENDKVMIGNMESSPKLVKEMKDGQELAGQLKEEGILPSEN